MATLRLRREMPESPRHLDAAEDDTPGPRPWVEELTAAWLADDLLSAEQRDRILRHEAEAPVPVTPDAGLRHGQSLAVEALGYLGGVILVVGVILLGTQVWDDLATPARLALVGGSAAILIAVGAAAGPALAVRAGAVGDRLRSVLWLAGVPAAAGFFAVIADDVLDLDGTEVGLVASGGATAVAAWLWLADRAALQQLAMMVGAAVTTALAIVDLSSSDALPGLGVWCVGVIWAVLAWGGVLAHRTVTLPAGAAVAVFGGLTMIPDGPGTVLALVTAGAVVLAAVLLSDLLLLAVGSVGSLFVLLAAVTNWWPDRLVAPFALLALGAILLLAALQVARHRRARQTPAREHAQGRPVVAWAVAAPLLAVLLIVLITVAVA